MANASESTFPEKVLVIESDKDFGQQIVNAFNAGKYIVTLVTDGKLGFQSVSATLPQLVVLDIVLMNGDGYDILSAMRADQQLAKIPVFLMSTKGDAINMRRVPQGSVSEFIVSMQPDAYDIVARANKLFGKKPEPSPLENSEIVNKKKILWVEDDKLIGTILGKKLISSGFDLFHATNGEDALKAVKNFIPDAIILDLLLPGMSGFDILQKCRMDPQLKDIPVMILSNLSKPGDFEKARMLGAQKFLVKAALSLDQIVNEIRDLAR